MQGLILLSLTKYNIMLIDELDTTLDASTRAKFIGIIQNYMQLIHSDQVFLISHNNMFDMYRVNTLEDLESTGFFDYIDSGVMLIEWSENIENFIPKSAIKISIEKTSYENERIITIEGDENFENTCR